MASERGRERDMPSELRKHLSEPWFSLVAVGAKRFEGRLGNNADFGSARKGTEVTWYNDDLGQTREVRTRIASKRRYASFASLLRAKGVAAVLPTVASLEHGAAVYAAFYPESKQKEHGVLCIELELLDG